MLSAILGGIFIYSGIIKADPIQRFEYLLVDNLHISWVLSAIFSRIIIGIEIGLGCLLVLNLFGRNKWVLFTGIYLIIIFSVYLIYLWIKVGDHVNCGCFGDKIFISPSSSLFKNAVLLVLLIILLRYYNGWQSIIPNKLAIILLLIISVSPFMFSSIPTQQTTYLKDLYRLDLAPLYIPGKADTPKINLHAGKHIIAFFSLGCPHCRLAALKMHLMKQQDTSLPFYMVLAGRDENWNLFWQESKAWNIPDTKIADTSFIRLTGGTYPYIVWINNGWVVAKTNFYPTLDNKEIKKWMK